MTETAIYTCVYSGILGLMKPTQLPTPKHKDVTERLTKINPNLAGEARRVLEINKSERHIRGGMATKEKYLHQHTHIQKL